jgi:hypothetical protein
MEIHPCGMFLFLDGVEKGAGGRLRDEEIRLQTVPKVAQDQQTKLSTKQTNMHPSSRVSKMMSFEWTKYSILPLILDISAFKPRRLRERYLRERHLMSSCADACVLSQIEQLLPSAIQN